jgi:hypothetical protein
MVSIQCGLELDLGKEKVKVTYQFQMVQSHYGSGPFQAV